MQRVLLCVWSISTPFAEFILFNSSLTIFLSNFHRICQDEVDKLRVSYLLTGNHICSYGSLMILLIRVPSSLTQSFFYPRRSVFHRLFPGEMRRIPSWQLLKSHFLLRSCWMIAISSFLLPRWHWVIGIREVIYGELWWEFFSTVRFDNASTRWVDRSLHFSPRWRIPLLQPNWAGETSMDLYNRGDRESSFFCLSWQLYYWAISGV